MSWTLETAAKELRSGNPKSAYDVCTWGLRERYYEWLYGIESAGVVGYADLGFDDSTGHMYEATSYLILNTVFSRVNPKDRSSREVFLDVGCGMGRAVLAAATYPYAAVIGIEISERLLEVARKNVARMGSRAKCDDIRLVQTDASQYQIPDEVTTIFFYNTFRGEPMRRTMGNIRDSLNRRKRTISIAFVEPAHYNLGDYPWITAVAEERCFYPSRRDGIKILFCRAGL